MPTEDIPEADDLIPANEQEAIQFEVGPVRRLIELLVNEAIAVRATEIMVLHLGTKLSVLFRASHDWEVRDTLPEWLWHLILSRLHRMLAIERHYAGHREDYLSFPNAQPAPADCMVQFERDRVTLSVSAPATPTGRGGQEGA